MSTPLPLYYPYLIRELYLEGNERKCAIGFRTEHDHAAQKMHHCRSGSTDSRSSAKAVQQVFAEVDLVADGAVRAGAVMVGLCGDEDKRAQHGSQQQHRQQDFRNSEMLFHVVSLL